MPCRAALDPCAMKLCLPACMLQYMNAKGKFVDPHTVEATERNGTKTLLTAERIVIAVGGRPKYPDVPGGWVGALAALGQCKPPRRILPLVPSGCPQRALDKAAGAGRCDAGLCAASSTMK